MTIDRFLTTKAACKDFIGLVGSYFVEQGKRAFDALSAATGDSCNLACCSGGRRQRDERSPAGI
jgi:ribose transport system substrate-binding protein